MDKPSKTPLEDLRKNALAHYDKASGSIQEHSSSVPQAINYYFDKMIEKEESNKYSLTKADLSWLMSSLESRSERYTDAEDMLLDIAKSPWYKRFFLRRKILNFITSRYQKFNF